MYNLILKDGDGNQVAGWSFQFDSVEDGTAWANAKLAAGAWDFLGFNLSQDEDGNDVSTRRANFSFQEVAPDIESMTQKALNNQGLGAQVIARVAAVNESKLAAGSMTQQQFTALLADQNMANIERLLWNGSLVTAKAMISALDNTYYSSDEISSILAMLP